MPRYVTTVLGLLAAALVLAACTGSNNTMPTELRNAQVGVFTPMGPPVARPVTPVSAPAEYRIRRLDKIDVIVFQVRELTLQGLQVDSSGQLNLPLVGQVPVTGHTTSEVSEEIARRLRATYLRNPQVTVIVSERAIEKVSVQGAVTRAGVFDLTGPTGLAEAVAMAQGITRSADPRQVAIIRQVEGRPHAAVFNLTDVLTARAPNPQIQADDVVYVGESGRMATWRSTIEGLPLLTALSYVAR